MTGLTCDTRRRRLRSTEWGIADCANEFSEHLNRDSNGADEKGDTEASRSAESAVGLFVGFGSGRQISGGHIRYGRRLSRYARHVCERSRSDGGGDGGVGAGDVDVVGVHQEPIRAGSGGYKSALADDGEDEGQSGGDERGAEDEHIYRVLLEGR